MLWDGSTCDWCCTSDLKYLFHFKENLLNPKNDITFHIDLNAVGIFWLFDYLNIHLFMLVQTRIRNPNEWEHPADIN